MMNRLAEIAFHPYPLRLPVAQKIRNRWRGFSREHYLACIQRAAVEAVQIGHKRLTVIEFGVAAGAGLVEMEKICTHLETRHPIQFDIVGFDTGRGLPKPTDYRDTPWKWSEGWYEMDVPALKKRLKRAELVLGDVAETVPAFMASGLRSPIGAVAFDLDYYSSTMHALRVLGDTRHETCLPRTCCYFDDLGSIEDVGVMRAISDFNEEHPRRKIRSPMNWYHKPNPYLLGWKLFECHDFDHPDYGTLIRKKKK